jgi:hypothetical protein
MSALVAPITEALVPPSSAMLQAIDRVHEQILACSQCEIATEHLIHGGMYARTIRLVPGTKMVGSLIRRATILIVQGDCAVLIGDKRIDLSGYNIIPGCAGRKQFFVTQGPVEMTMIYPTSARTVEEAENEIFAEADQLVSRKDGSRDQVTITGQ